MLLKLIYLYRTSLHVICSTGPLVNLLNGRSVAFFREVDEDVDDDGGSVSGPVEHFLIFFCVFVGWHPTFS